MWPAKPASQDAHTREEGKSPAQVPYLETQDDGPDEAKSQPVVPVHDVVGPHVLKMDSLLLQELQGLVHILQTVDAHSSLGGFRLEVGEQEVETSPNGADTGHSYCQRSCCPFSGTLSLPTKTLNPRVLAHSVQGQYLPNSL